MNFIFLHISDLHFGLKIRGIERLTYCKRALLKSVNIVKNHDLDAVIIAGDLFEKDTLYREEIEFFTEIFKLIYPKPVIISPGNHDFLDSGCVYDESLLNILGIKWPENVKIFRKPEFSFFSFGDIKIYGKPCVNRQTKAFDMVEHINPSKINIAAIHGSRTNFIPKGKEIWHPFEDSDILKSNFDYVALGHYHSYSEISDDSVIRAAYPGSMVPASIYEYDKRGGLIVEVIKENNKTTVEIEFVELSDFSIRKIELPPSKDTEKIKNIVLNEILNSVNPRDTLFVLKIRGMGDLNILHLKESLNEYKILFDTSEFIKVDIEKLREISHETTLGTFIQKMFELIDKADDKEKQILKEALLYGLDAFAGRQITPIFYED